MKWLQQPHHRHADQTYKPTQALTSGRPGGDLSGSAHRAGDSHELFRCAEPGVSISTVVARMIYVHSRRSFAVFVANTGLELQLPGRQSKKKADGRLFVDRQT